MADRKYRITSEKVYCYVSSAFNYHFHIHVNYTQLNYSFEFDEFMWVYKGKGEQFKNPPKYLRESVIGVIKQAIIDGNVTYYEYSQQGEKRFDDLRYHDPSHVSEMAQRFKENQK
jgi:hypothetical protein